MASKDVPFYSLGPSNYRVPLSLFSTNRDKLTSALRCLKETIRSNATVTIPTNVTRESQDIVYLEGGASQTRFDTDHEPIFRQESYFHYLFGVREPDVVGIIHVPTGESILFVPRLPVSIATWIGKIPSLEEIRSRYGIDKVLYRDEMAAYWHDRVSSQHDCITNVLLMDGVNSDSGNRYQAPTTTLTDILSTVGEDFPIKISMDTTTLFPILANCRVTKSNKELDLIRHVTEMTSMGHVYVMKHIGRLASHAKSQDSGQHLIMEYQAEALFQYYTYYSFGARLMSYTPICACGPNGAALHYGHAGAPNDAPIFVGQLCLFDMGAEYYGYGSDVTCTFPASGTFTDRQRKVYSGVLEAQKIVMSMIKPGVSWVDCHKAAEHKILEALIDLGIVVLEDPSGNKYTVHELVEMRLCAIFMPHGLGHLIGIDTHDVGGYLTEYGMTPPRMKEAGLNKLRTSRLLEKNMTLTVEPGCYFIDHLLDEALQSPLFSGFLNKSVLEEYRGFGGVRLEDVVVVTNDGCENYTICPRTVEEIQLVMEGSINWPPIIDSCPELKRVRLTSGGVILPNL